MPRVAIILGNLFATVAMGCADSFAQAPKPARAKKVTEFETAGYCDLTARLDFLAIEVQNNPGTSAYVLTYAPEASESDLLELWLVPAGQSLPDITQKSENPEESNNVPPATPVKRP